jgi:hypothetical protein
MYSSLAVGANERMNGLPDRRLIYRYQLITYVCVEVAAKLCKDEASSRVTPSSKRRDINFEEKKNDAAVSKIINTQNRGENRG